MEHEFRTASMFGVIALCKTEGKTLYSYQDSTPDIQEEVRCEEEAALHEKQTHHDVQLTHIEPEVIWSADYV